MKNLQNLTQAEIVVPNFTISHFNDLICEEGGGIYWIPFEDQTIATFVSCGFNFVVASSFCQHPLATSVAILTELAYSEESMKGLGECGAVTMICDPGDYGPIKTTFMLLPEGRPDTHIQFVIHAGLGYVVLPCFLDWEVEDTDLHWLREKIIRGIVGYTPEAQA